MSKFTSGNRVDPVLDQFYTKDGMAKLFMDIIKEHIDLSKYTNIIEPAAGRGNILDHMPKGSIGLDLEPAREDIIEMDFFDYKFPEGKNIVITNPPFGRASKLAVDFFNKSAKYADTIAFIIPNSWKYNKVQNRLDSSFKLIYQSDLPKFAFIKQGESRGKRILKDGSININCVIQIWTKDESAIDLRVTEDRPGTHKDFDLIGYFTKDKEQLRKDHDYDFILRAWGGFPFPKNGPGPLAFGHIRTNTDGLKGNWAMQYTGIKANNKNVRAIFDSIPIEDWWTNVTSMNTIHHELIIELYIKHKKKWKEQQKKN